MEEVEGLEEEESSNAFAAPEKGIAHHGGEFVFVGVSECGGTGLLDLDTGLLH